MVNTARVARQIIDIHEIYHNLFNSQLILMIKGLNLCKILGYNLFSQYIRFFCGFKPFFNTFSPGPLKTGLDRFLVVFGSPSPQLFGSGNFWDRTGP